MTRTDEIRERCEAATHGPWKCIEKGNSVISHAVVTVAYVGMPQTHICGAISPQSNNADFIAHAREDIPWLLAELKRVKAERDAAIADIERMLTYDDGDNGWVCAYCKPERNCVLDETCNPKWRGIQAATEAEEGGAHD